MNIIDEFADRISVLNNANYRDVAGRLVAILTWLESEPITKGILIGLRSKTDVQKLLASRHPRDRPIANTREEIAVVGLALTEMCRDNEFWGICQSFNIRPRYSATNLGDICDEGLRAYVFPFFEHVNRELRNAAEGFSTSSIADHQFEELLGNDIRDLFPVTVANLQRISREFLRPHDDVSWQNIGNSCRQTLIEFATELEEVSGIERPEGVQESNVKGILKHVLSKAGGRFSETLEKLQQGVWDHTQAVVHRPTVSKKEALRAYLWTGMLISEFAGLVRAYNET